MRLCVIINGVDGDERRRRFRPFNLPLGTSFTGNNRLWRHRPMIIKGDQRIFAKLAPSPTNKHLQIAFRSAAIFHETPSSTSRLYFFDSSVEPINSRAEFNRARSVLRWLRTRSRDNLCLFASFLFFLVA